MRSLALLFLAATAWAQTEPAVTDGQFRTIAFQGDLTNQLQSPQPTWFGYAVKTARGEHDSCCWDGGHRGGCSLENERRVVIGNDRQNTQTVVKLEGTDTVALLFRIGASGIEKVRSYSLSCPLDAGGLPFVWLTGVPAHQSLEFLKKLVAVSSRQVSEGAIFGISQHAGEEAVALLIQEAKGDPSPHIREQALFWLAQRAGSRASAAIMGAIENDPDTKVKESAVFALSQLPGDEAVPKLIEVAKNQKNRQVCRQAFFWLGQSRDPRALGYIQQVLTR